MNRIILGCLCIVSVYSYAYNDPAICSNMAEKWRFDDHYDWYDTEPIISVRSLMCDLKNFGRNLFTGDALGVFAPFLPFWAASYSFDDRAHHRFYCEKHHTNKNQCSCHWADLSECLVGVSIGSLVSCSFAVKNRQLQRTAQLYAITLPITWAAKKLIKQIEWKGNRRPGSADYSKKCHWGGFPSGHMLEMTYATVLFGLSMGPGFAIPLGISTVIIGGTFVQTNRHYISQLVAGAAIGTLFGFAAYWAISQEEYRPAFNISCGRNDGGGLAVRASYTW